MCQILEQDLDPLQFPVLFLPVRQQLQKLVAEAVSILSNKSEQIENPVEAVPLDDQAESAVAPVVSNGAQIESPVEAQVKSVVAPVVSNGAVNGAAAEPLESDNLGEAVATNNISREVDNGKDLEIQKRPSEEQVCSFTFLCVYVSFTYTTLCVYMDACVASYLDVGFLFCSHQ